MNFQQEYRLVMDQMHASPDTLKEVCAMKQAKRSRINMRPLWIAAAVLLLSTAVFAATYSLWSPGLAGYFGADEDAQEELLESGMTTLVYGDPVTLENGLELTLEQVLCDGTQITASVRYDAPEGGWLTRENLILASQLTNSKLTIGSTDFNLNDWGFELDFVTETTAFMTMNFGGDCAALNGEIATLTMGPNVGRISGMQENQPEDVAVMENDPLILPGDVEFSWTLDMADAICRRLEGSFSGEYEGMTLTVEEVTITPVSISFLTTEGDDLRQNLYVKGFVLADGTEIGISDGGYGYFQFDTTITDMDSVVGIAFASWENTPVAEGDAETVFVLSLK